MVKEADALAEAGHQVEVLGMNSLPHLVEEDQELVEDRKWKYTAVSGPLNPTNREKAFRYRLSRRIANELAARTGIQTEAQLGGWRKDILREALARKADLTVAHSASTLWVARELMKRGRKVAVDFEDWFSREHEKAPWHPDKVIAKLEKEVLAGASHTTCTSEAMAEAIREAYGQKPEVIYNVFPMVTAPQPAPDPGPEGPKVLWISQALGPGRGLELLADALAYCEPTFTLALVGNSQGNYQKELEKRIPQAWKGRVRFQGQVKDREVIHLVSRFHIGLALELRNTPNHDLTCSNKMFQYLACGLAVAATATAGQKEVAKVADAAVLAFAPEDPSDLAKILRRWSGDVQALQPARRKARQIAEQKFCWEIEGIKLLRIFTGQRG